MKCLLNLIDLLMYINSLMKKSFCNVKKMRPFNRSIFVIIGFIVQKKVHMSMCTFNEIGVIDCSTSYLLVIKNLDVQVVHGQVGRDM
jgi:hypothetical protein